MKKLLVNLAFNKGALNSNIFLFKKFIFWILSLSFWKEPFIFLGEGSQRRVYGHKNFVIKIPLDWDGLNSNDREARVYKSTNDGWSRGIKRARCRLHPSGLLIMEYVAPAHRKSLPEWACYVDCQQVGYNRKGQLVAYDYGY